MIPGNSAQSAFEPVVRLLGARTGLQFAPNRIEDAEAGIRRAMAKARVAEVGRYLEVLESDEAALDELVVEVTVGETYFFREPAQLAFIRDQVLPDLSRRRGRGHALRVLSAGCASGEETYSLAILLQEAGLLTQAHLIGVDISRAALARARQGAYGRWSLRGLDACVQDRYFHPVGDRWLVEDGIRRCVGFEYLNLATDAYPSLVNGIWNMDLVLCRNVLIYLDAATVRWVAERLFLTLADGGWLVTGPSDPPLSELAPFETVVTPAGLFYRRGRRSGRVFLRQRPLAAVPTSGLEPPPVAPSPEPAPIAPRAVAEIAAERAPTEVDRLAQARQLLAAGDYDAALELLRGLEDLAAVAMRVRALANREGSKAAAEVAEEAARRHPLVAELHFLHAVLLIDLGRLDEAVQGLRRVLYLDRSLAMAHLALGSLLRRRGDLVGARRAYRNAAELASARPEDEPVPLGDGERAGRLAQAARSQAALLDAGWVEAE